VDQEWPLEPPSGGVLYNGSPVYSKEPTELSKTDVIAYLTAESRTLPVPATGWLAAVPMESRLTGPTRTGLNRPDGVANGKEYRQQDGASFPKRCGHDGPQDEPDLPNLPGKVRARLVRVENGM